MCVSYSIPYLEFDVLVVDLYGACAEFYSYGQVVLLPEPLVSELQQQARLTNAYTS